MPAAFTISNGTTTVDLYSKANNYYALYPTNLNVGDVENDVDEVIQLAYGSARNTTNERASDNNELEALLQQAADYWNANNLINIPPVYITMRAIGESSNRYCLLKAGRIATVQAHVIGQKEAARAVLLLTREGFWRDVAPYGTLRSIVASTNIQNRMETSIATSNNLISITAPAAGAGAALNIGVATTNGKTFNRLIIGKRTGSSTFLAKFDPHFWSNSDYFFDAGGATLTATADAPDNEAYVTGTVAGTKDPEWRISLSDVEAYVGNFHLFAKAKITNATGAATIQLVINNVAYDRTLRDLDTSDWLVDMGLVQLPVYNYPPGWNPGDVSGPYRINMSIVNSGGANVTLYGFWLVPADEGIFMAANTSAIGFILGGDRVQVDGTREACYVVNSSGDLNVIYEIAGDGVYLDAPGGASGDRDTRLWFFVDDLTDFDYDVNLNVVITGYYRFPTLRGNA